MPETFETLFDKYGGVTAVQSIVATFYQRLLNRPNLRRYFRHTDMKRLQMHQVKFIAYVMGKPAEFYEGRTLQDAHAGFGISETSFDEVANILEWTLEDYDLERADIDSIMDAVAKTRPLIVNH